MKIFEAPKLDEVTIICDAFVSQASKLVIVENISMWIFLKEQQIR